jgi:uncharacterized protein YqgC (DUF456 family)
MNLSSPKQITFLIAVVLIVLGLIGVFVPAIGGLFVLAKASAAFWFTFAGGALLALGCLLKGL